MTLDDAIKLVLQDTIKYPQCHVCKLVRDTDLTDDKLREHFAAIGGPKLAAAIRLHHGAGPSSDAIRNHLARHVA